jgi:predicted dehydrogenase
MCASSLLHDPQAQAGKHVLVEKPVAATLKDAEEIRDACVSNNVLLMDGVMFMHNKRLGLIRTVMESGALGTADRVVSSFSFPGDAAFQGDNIRVKTELEPLGALGDLGWCVYCIARSFTIAFRQPTKPSPTSILRWNTRQHPS